MKITLAGYNVDCDALQEAHISIADHADEHKPGVALTPETLSAAYARISRSSKSATELRGEAALDVAKARKSNETIVFGYGHASVAEHAVLNFDVMDISRLAIEWLEHSRLCSYTEKSQRYLQLTDASEMVVPADLPRSLDNVENGFRGLFALQIDAYQRILKLLKADEEKQGRPQGGSAEEDARYVTSLAVKGQLGMTLNARSLEVMIRRLASSPLEEVRRIGTRLHEEAKGVIPSLLRYCSPEKVRQPRNFALPYLYAMARQDPVVMEGLNEHADGLVLAAMMHSVSRAPFSLCCACVENMPNADRWKAFQSIYETMDTHSAAPRQFELPACTFELVGSASFFAQLKRHRMATILPQPYEPSLGVTIPESIETNAKALTIFYQVQRATEELYEDLYKHDKDVAPYVLMQAHRRRVLVKMNVRELVAFARLRKDKHAQWEIRAVAHEMIKQARKEMPMTLALACGKNVFEDCQHAVLRKGVGEL